MNIIDLINQNKYLHSLDELEKIQASSEYKVSEIILFYKKVIDGLKNSSEKKYQIALLQFIKYLYEKKEFSEINRNIHYVKKNKEILLIEIESLEKTGNLERLHNKYIELCEYLRMKTLYQEINSFLSGLDHLNFELNAIGLINSFTILDVNSTLGFFENIKEEFINEAMFNEYKYDLLTELIKRIERFYGIHSDLDYLIDQLTLFKRYQEIQKSSKIKRSDLSLMIELLLYSDNFEIIKYITKYTFEAGKKNLSMELARYLERNKEFDYFNDVRGDHILKKVFTELRQYQTGIKKVYPGFQFDQKTREFKFDNPAARKQQEMDISRILSEYNFKDDTYENIQNDLINQVRHGVFDDATNVEDIVMSLEMLGLKKVVDEFIKKSSDKINDYFIANHYFNKGSFYECIVVCDEKIIDKNLNKEEFWAFVYLKALALKENKEYGAVVKILSIIYRENPGYRRVKQLIDECKSSK